jgi:hypothetical protein
MGFTGSATGRSAPSVLRETGAIFRDFEKVLGPVGVTTPAMVTRTLRVWGAQLVPAHPQRRAISAGQAAGLPRGYVTCEAAAAVRGQPAIPARRAHAILDLPGYGVGIIAVIREFGHLVYCDNVSGTCGWIVLAKRCSVATGSGIRSCSTRRTRFHAGSVRHRYR